MSIPGAIHAGKPASAIGQIYPAASSASLLGRSWCMYRTHWKLCLKVTGGLMALFLLSGLMLSGAQILPTMKAFSFTNVILAVITFILGLLIRLGAFYLLGLAGCVLSRFFCSAIILRQPIPLSGCVAHLKRIWLSATGIMILGGLLSFACGLIDVGIIGMGVLGSVLVATLYTIKNIIISAGATVTIVLLGSLTFILLLGMISIQMLLFWMPLVTVANPELCLPPSPQAGSVVPATPDVLQDQMFTESVQTMSVSQAFAYTFRLFFSNLPKAFLFGLMLFIFTFVVSITLQMPMNIWMVMEYGRTAYQGNSMPGALPFYVTVAMHAWSSLIPGLLFPFTVGSMTLFWYDCKVVKEAFDLRLWLATLRQKLLAA